MCYFLSKIRSKFCIFAQNSDLSVFSLSKERHNFFVLKDKHKLFFVKLFVISVFYNYPKNLYIFYSEITHIYQMFMNVEKRTSFFAVYLSNLKKLNYLRFYENWHI